jgi:hypothetical protein
MLSKAGGTDRASMPLRAGDPEPAYKSLSSSRARDDRADFVVQLMR